MIDGSSKDKGLTRAMKSCYNPRIIKMWHKILVKGKQRMDRCLLQERKQEIEIDKGLCT